MAADGQMGGNSGAKGPAIEVLETTGGTEAASW
jgi:hypothetical protein